MPAPPSAQVNVSSSGVGLGHVDYGAHGSYYGTVDTGGVGSSGGVGSTDARSGSPVNTGGPDRTSLWHGSGTELGANISRHGKHFLQCIETQPFSYNEATSLANSTAQGNVGACNVIFCSTVA